MSFEFIENGTPTTPQGFLATGVTAGFKRSGAPDFAMVVSEVPAEFAGVFTSCTFAAAPVQLCKKRVLENDFLRAVIINSGNANACTGEQGMASAVKSCEIAAQALNIPVESVAVATILLDTFFVTFNNFVRDSYCVTTFESWHFFTSCECSFSNF